MLTPEIHAQRRSTLAKAVGAPILLMGNGDRPRNLPMSTVPFRQDSTFLYFTGCTAPGAAVLIEDGVSTLYLPRPADDDALWHGTTHTIEETAAALGFNHASGHWRSREGESGRAREGEHEGKAGDSEER